MSDRFVRVYTDLIDSTIWKDDGCLKLYLYFLFKATWQTYKTKSCVLLPGQFEFSHRSCISELGWGHSSFQKRLDMLISSGLIQVTKNKRYGSIVTITDKRLININHNEDKSVASNNCGRFQVMTSSDSVTEVFNSKCSHSGSASDPISGALNSGCSHSGSASDPIPGALNSECSHSGSASDPIPGPVNNINTTKKNKPLLQEPPDFKRLWLAYPEPRRVGKSEAMEMYAQALAEGATIEAFLKALDVSKQSEDWQRENGRFIPKLVNWLEKESWRDNLYDYAQEEAAWKTE